ncbi:hypothetical protein PSN45_002077 [Yamadazyma tenuis]|nr:hypothetical protein PSN45_002077 [Yamadazyma tenuis]
MVQHKTHGIEKPKPDPNLFVEDGIFGKYKAVLQSDFRVVKMKGMLKPYKEAAVLKTLKRQTLKYIKTSNSIKLIFPDYSYCLCSPDFSNLRFVHYQSANSPITPSEAFSIPSFGKNLTHIEDGAHLFMDLPPQLSPIPEFYMSTSQTASSQQDVMDIDFASDEYSSSTESDSDFVQDVSKSVGKLALYKA